ncbi:hypothetical protein ACLKA7_015696 [Drosophila subpalustris]
MSEEIIEAIATEIETVRDDEEEEEDSFWDASDNESLLTSEKADDLLTTNENSEVGELVTDSTDMPQCLDKLKIIHERVARIMKRVGFLSDSLKKVHQELKTYSNEKDDDALKFAKSCGDIGSTQTDPLDKPELNMLVERIGDTVACQTIEDNPFAD